MSVLNIEGAKLSYQKVGQGPILIFIPGANGTGDIFLPLAEQLKHLFCCNGRSSWVWGQ